MSDLSLFLPIAAAGFGIALAHAAIPTHWLPFVLTARSHGWSRGRTMGVTALAGLGHVLFTTLLGALLVWLGLAVDEWLGELLPFIAGGLLVAFGLHHLLRRGHRHLLRVGPAHDEDHAECCGGRAPPMRGRSELATITGLLLMLTLSPCESFLPVYLSATSFGWTGFLLLSLVLAAATVVGMLLLTWLTAAGIDRLRLAALERHENKIIGVLLCVLGVAVVLIEQGHHHH